MLNLLFAYPIYLINTNVGPTTHPYYTKFDGFSFLGDFERIRSLFYKFQILRIFRA